MTLSDEQFLSDPSIFRILIAKVKKLICLILHTVFIALPRRQKPAAFADVESAIITTEFFHSFGKIL